MCRDCSFTPRVVLTWTSSSTVRPECQSQAFQWPTSPTTTAAATFPINLVSPSTRMAAVSSSFRSLPYAQSLRSSRFSLPAPPARLFHSPGIRVISPIRAGGSRRFGYRAISSMSGMTESSKGKVEVFNSEEELAVSLAKYTADLSSKFVGERGAFTVVVSGGSLIKSLRCLAILLSL